MYHGTSMTSIAAIRTARRRIELAGPGGWRRGLGTIFAVGIRPCSGAILVLVFSLAQGLFWAGIAATFVMGLGTAITVATIAIVAVSAKGLARRLSSGREGGGALMMRGIEFGAAGLVLLFGARPVVRLSRRRTRDVSVGPQAVARMGEAISGFVPHIAALMRATCSKRTTCSKDNFERYHAVHALRTNFRCVSLSKLYFSRASFVVRGIFLL